MTYSQTRRKRTLLIAGAGLFSLLAGYATATTQSDTAAAEKTAMRADCQTMHDKMMAGNSKAMGDMPDHDQIGDHCAMMQSHDDGAVQ